MRTSDKMTELNYFKQFETDEKEEIIINETKPEQETEIKIKIRRPEIKIKPRRLARRHGNARHGNFVGKARHCTSLHDPPCPGPARPGPVRSGVALK